MYVTKADYKGRINLDLLNILLQEDEPTILSDTAATAESALRTMAGVLYDIEPELVKLGAARNYYLLGLAKSIALYEIYNRADDEDIPKKVIKNYDDAMIDLEKISLGKKNLSIPKKPVDEPEPTPGDDGDNENILPGGTGLRRIGSQPRRTHIV